MVARSKALDCSNPRHHKVAPFGGKHWSSFNRTELGRSSRNRKRRIKDQCARRSIPGKAGTNDRAVSGKFPVTGKISNQTRAHRIYFSFSLFLSSAEAIDRPTTD